MQPAQCSTWRQGWLSRVVLLLTMLPLIGGLAACTDPSLAYAPDGPYLHEVIKPASTRQHKAYAIILCKAADAPDTPLAASFIKQLFLKDGQGTGNIYDYFLNVSYGSIDLDGSQVINGDQVGPGAWVTMKTTRAVLLSRINTTRYQTENDCIQAAIDRVGFNRSSWDGVVTIINVPTDSGQSSDHGVVIGFPTDEGGTTTFVPSFIEHEMGHALTLVHSMVMNVDAGPVHTWSPGGDTEYGDSWDIMSALQTYGFDQRYYGESGPELEAAYRDQLGWMPSDRVYTYSGAGKATVTLAPVNAPRLSGSLMAKIPLAGLGAYTVEFRHKSDWDLGIPHDAVLIHELRLSTRPKETSSTRTFLVRRTNSSAWMPGQVFQDTANKVRISIDSMSGTSATITISDDVSTAPGPGTGGDLNCDPDCSPHVTLTSPKAVALRYDGHPITFAATVTDPVGGTLPDSNVVWTANGAALGTGRSFSTPLPKPGAYEIRVTATNSLGLQNVAGTNLILCDDATCTPRATISAPVNNAHVHAGVAFTLSGSVYNPEKESIADDQMIWTANGSRLGFGPKLTTSIGAAGTYTVTLSATNPLGYVGTASITVIVDPPTPGPTVSITSPVDGTVYYDVTSFGQSVTLQGAGSAGVNQFNWSDTLTGSLGSGQTLTVTLAPSSTANCALTTDVITLTGTRSDGQKASTSVTVTLRATCIR